MGLVASLGGPGFLGEWALSVAIRTSGPTIGPPEPGTRDQLKQLLSRAPAIQVAAGDRETAGAVASLVSWSDVVELVHRVQTGADVEFVGPLATALAAAALWRTRRPGPPMFRSQNAKLFSGALYLPTQLAKDADHGIFFEDRLVARLHTLGAVPPAATVVAMDDDGGWQSLATLQARLDVSFVSDDGKPAGVSVLGTALVPPPPVRPGDVASAARARAEFLGRFGVPTSLLAAEEGVLYSVRTEDFDSAVASRSGPERVSLVVQAAEIAAVLDSDFWTLQPPKIVTEWGQFSDVIAVGLENAATARVRGNDALTAVGVAGDLVVWSEFTRSPGAFRVPGGVFQSEHFQDALRTLDEDGRRIARSAYDARCRVMDSLVM